MYNFQELYHSKLKYMIKGVFKYVYYSYKLLLDND